MKKKTKQAPETSQYSFPNVTTEHSEDPEAKLRQMQLKIGFVLQENNDLKNKINDLRVMIKQKDEYLKQIFPEETKNSSAKGSTDLSSLKNQRNLNVKESVLQNLLEGVYSENQRLYELLEKISKERDEAKSKALISEQICDDLQSKEMEKIEEYNAKIRKLTQMIDNKENYIKNLEKISQQKPSESSEHEGNVYYKYVVEPNEQNVIMAEEVSMMKGIMKRLFKKYQEIKTRNVELIQINYCISNELQAIKAQPVNYGKNILPNNLDLSSIEIFHKKLWEETENDNNELSPVNSPLPDKIVRKPCDTSMISHNRQNETSFLTNSKVPKLDLTKAKKIQEINARKNFHQDSGNKENDARFVEKLKQFDNELTKCKIALQNEMLQNRLLQEQNDDLTSKVKSLTKELGSLKRAEAIYTEKIQRFFHYLNFYRNIYVKYLNLLNLVPKKQADLKEISLNKVPLTKTSPRWALHHPTTTSEDLYEPEVMDRRVKSLMNRDKEKSKSLNKTTQEIEDILNLDLSVENPSANHNKKQKYLGYLRKIANEFAEFVEKNKGLMGELDKKDQKVKRVSVLELRFLQKAKSQQRFFPNSSDFLADFDTVDNSGPDFLDLVSVRQTIQQKIEQKRDLNISKISKESEDWDLNISFLNENLNDVSQPGEILVMNKFQNPFQVNFKNKLHKKNLAVNHPKIPGKLYSPLSKINPDIREVSFENADAKKLNRSFISNNDELFF